MAHTGHQLRKGRASLRRHRGGAVAEVMHTQVRSASNTTCSVIGLAEGVHVKVSGPGCVGEQETVLAGHRVFSDVASQRWAQVRRQGDRPDAGAGLWRLFTKESG